MHQNYRIKQLSPHQVITLYRDTAPAHFPADELKPLSSIETLLAADAYLGLGLFDETDSLLGYALFLTVPGLDVSLLDYYAILEEYRDLGLGSIFLQKMKSHFNRLSGILIETEDPDFAADDSELLQRNRRNAFYYKNTARPTGISCSLFGVPFNILFLDTNTQIPESPDTLRRKLDTIYHFMLPEDSYLRNVSWH